jgi:hypothetical protein
VKIAKDGLVYICDRSNDRIQVFRKDGTFVKEFIIEKNTLGPGSVWDLDFWIDPKQTFLVNADGTNNEVRTLRRETGETVGAFGRNGRNAGEFHWALVASRSARSPVELEWLHRLPGRRSNASRLPV